MAEYRFTVVYKLPGSDKVFEVRFSGTDRNATNAEAAQFSGLLLARGLEFRVWNPEHKIVNQSLGVASPLAPCNS